MSHLVPLSHALAVGWTVELLAEMNMPIRGDFVDFTEYRARVLSRWCGSGELPTLPPVPGSLGDNDAERRWAAAGAVPPQASHWRDTAMKLSDDVVRERTYSARLAKRVVVYQLLALGGWVLFVAALVNRWAV